MFSGKFNWWRFVYEMVGSPKTRTHPTVFILVKRFKRLNQPAEIQIFRQQNSPCRVGSGRHFIMKWHAPGFVKELSRCSLWTRQKTNRRYRTLENIRAHPRVKFSMSFRHELARINAAIMCSRKGNWLRFVYEMVGSPKTRTHPTIQKVTWPGNDLCDDLSFIGFRCAIFGLKIF